MNFHWDTCPQTEQDPNQLSRNKEELVLFGAPVYGGRIPPLAAKRLSRLKGNQTPAVVIVVYGNRAFEDALLELSDLVRARGFIPIAGAAFIGEHSFSTHDNPIAKARPDQADLKNAEIFGEKIKEKISGHITCLASPGNLDKIVPARGGQRFRITISLRFTLADPATTGHLALNKKKTRPSSWGKVS